MEPSGQTVRILLVDDHLLMRRGLRALLDDEKDLEVIAEAGDGREAIRLVAAEKPDVVIMDISMPGLNGIEATRRILRQDNSCQVLALSMHPEARVVSEMLRAGASGYIVKNCPMEEFVRAVRAVCRGRTYLSPEIAGHVVKGLRSNSKESGTAAQVLSARQREVLQLVAEGHSSKEIAHRLHVTARTVEAHRRSIMEKLDLRSVAELTKYAIREGLTSIDT